MEGIRNENSVGSGGNAGREGDSRRGEVGTVMISAKMAVFHTSFGVTHDTGSLFHSKVPESQLGTVRP